MAYLKYDCFCIEIYRLGRRLGSRDFLWDSTFVDNTNGTVQSRLPSVAILLLALLLGLYISEAYYYYYLLLFRF